MKLRKIVKLVKFEIKNNMWGHDVIDFKWGMTAGLIYFIFIIWRLMYHSVYQNEGSGNRFALEFITATAILILFCKRNIKKK